MHFLSEFSFLTERRVLYKYILNLVREAPYYICTINNVNISKLSFPKKVLVYDNYIIVNILRNIFTL